MPSNDSPRRSRILIEASKLADVPMDGIKRYVVELLRFVATAVGEGRTDLGVDVMVLDQVHPLADLPERYPDLFRAADEPGEPGGGDAPAVSAAVVDPRDRILRGLGSLVPPISLHVIRALLPAWAVRRFLGKEKSELAVPHVDPRGRNLLALILPPIAVSVLQRMLTRRLMLFLWSRGIVVPAPKPVDLDPYDLVHLTLPNNHHYLRPTQAPVLVTVHDLCHITCPQFQTRDNSLTLGAGLVRAIDTGAHFVAVSEATREQMIEVYGIEESRVVTVASGCDRGRFHPVRDPAELARVRRRYAIPETRFLLTLCTIEPRKNLAGTLEAFDLLAREPGAPEVVLVIAGAKGWKSREVLRAAADNAARVILTGYVEDADLAALYSAATGFVYASHYEGFGFPLLEAMSCGTPVVYGDNSSMPEIVGDAGLPVDSRDPRDLARQLQRLLGEADLAEQLGARALERAAMFSWERSAAETLALYDKLLVERVPA